MGEGGRAGVGRSDKSCDTSGRHGPISLHNTRERDFQSPYPARDVGSIHPRPIVRLDTRVHFAHSRSRSKVRWEWVSCSCSHVYFSSDFSILPLKRSVSLKKINAVSTSSKHHINKTENSCKKASEASKHQRQVKKLMKRIKLQAPSSTLAARSNRYEYSSKNEYIYDVSYVNYVVLLLLYYSTRQQFRNSYFG